jgi:Mce-associated membrane protein
MTSRMTEGVTDRSTERPPAPTHDDPTTATRPGTAVGTWTFSVLAVLATAALIVCGVLAYRAHAASQVDAARTQGLAAARSAAGVVLAYDHRHLDRDFARASGLLTGEFAEEYAMTTKDSVRSLATKTRAVVRADVRSASVVSASPERVVVLLFVNQTTTSSRTSEPRTDLNRVRMTLERVGGRWLVSDVDAL